MEYIVLVSQFVFWACPIAIVAAIHIWLFVNIFQRKQKPFSVNIPFDIQMEIIKKVPDVKSLIRFRSISKRWKSSIDNSDFIKGYGSHNTQPHTLIISYKFGHYDNRRYICFVDDDIQTFKVQKQELTPFVVCPRIEQYNQVIGVCHGLVCLYGFQRCGYRKPTFPVVLWNPSLGKSFGIVIPVFLSRTHTDKVIGFGVCPVTSDPTVVHISHVAKYMPWHVEFFTLSSRVWNEIPINNIFRKSVELNASTQVVIDRFIYWGASELTFDDDGKATTISMVVSFDLITKEFKVVDLPHSLRNKLGGRVSVSKLRESLVVYQSINFERVECCDVWVREHDSSFRKLFTIGAPLYKILGFRKNGEPIFEIRESDGCSTTLNVYDPSSQQIKNLGISGIADLFFMDSYKESLLLLDHVDSRIYGDNTD